MLRATRLQFAPSALALRSNSSAPVTPKANTIAARANDLKESLGVENFTGAHIATKKLALWMPMPTIDKRERADVRPSADLGVLIRFANTASPKQSPPVTAAEYCSTLVEET